MLLSKNENLTSANTLASPKQGLWRSIWLASRPKTLTASLVPIAAGSAYAARFHGQWSFWVIFFSLNAALAIQIGTNFFNDALDFIKGADSHTRLGEARATQSGWLSSKAVGLWGSVFFLYALVCGIPLVMMGGWPIVFVGLASLLMGYLYTGGPFPLAYKGLGDLFVLIFFGWVAVGGTVYLHSGVYDFPAFILGTQVGLLSMALIAINNIRDQKEDALVGKRTLAVRLGQFSRWEVLLIYFLFFTLNFYWGTLSEWFIFAMNAALIFPAYKLSRDVLRHEPGRIYNQFLARSSLIHILFGLAFSAGVFL